MKKLFTAAALVGVLALAGCANLDSDLTNVTTHASGTVTAAQSVATDGVTIVSELVQTAVALVNPVKDLVLILGAL